MGNKTRAKSKPNLAVIDFETDPFQYGRLPKAFCVEFYSDDEYAVFWGEDCADRLGEYLDNLRHKYLIYAHNGGRFDIHYLHKYIDNPVRIINARVVSAKIFKHTIRDSFAIIPVPLAVYKKTKIDYSHMEADVRETYKDEILAYLHDDCVDLFEVVSAFVDRFGPMLTVGSTAITELQKLHTFEQMIAADDPFYRQFYYGGRVQCFKAGVLTGPYIGLDVNSSYPHTMKCKRHPYGGFAEQSKLPDNFDRPYFAIIEATNIGALPCIQEGSLNFNSHRNVFFACSHEIEVALQYGLLDIHKVEACHVSNDWICFDTFVDKFYAEKVLCKQTGDRIGELFAKFMLNSCYGKFGQNPANYSDWLINRDWGMDSDLHARGYEKEYEDEDFELWSHDAMVKQSAFYNVAIAASITSGARATLLDGLHSCVDPVYCDTDSLICREFTGVVDPHTLGAWKQEFTSSHVAIAGKKLYTAYNVITDDTACGEPRRTRNEKVKLASKGGTLTTDQIITIASGGSHSYRQDAPVFSLHTLPRFSTRNFNMTVRDDLDEIEHNN